jgi:type IV pilus assembly protein PilN
MIRINLLPVRQSKKRETVQQQLLAFAGVLVVTLIVCVVWSAYKSSILKDRQQQITERKNEIQQLDKVIGEVNEFTARKKELEEKLEIIDQLKKGKTGPVRALDDLATEVPNRIWLTKLVERGGSMTLEGTAIDHEAVSAFMKALEKSKYFSGIVLGYSKEKNDKGNKLYEFKITCSVNYAA